MTQHLKKKINVHQKPKQITNNDDNNEPIEPVLHFPVRSLVEETACQEN